MNYHSDSWIMDRLQEHYQEALTIFPKEKILSVELTAKLTAPLLILWFCEYSPISELRLVSTLP